MLKPFLFAVRKLLFFPSIAKMLQKFSFGDSLLQDVACLRPDKMASYSFVSVLLLARLFPSTWSNRIIRLTMRGFLVQTVCN